jgi:hypothetical protein
LNQQRGSLLDDPSGRFPEAIFKAYTAPISHETPASKSK